MEFLRKNEVGATNYFDVSTYGIKLYKDPLKINTASMDLDRSTPVSMFDVITIDNNGEIPFRGYVTGISRPRRGTQTIECQSLEGWLNRRRIPLWAWVMESGQVTGDQGDWLDYILTHDTPPQSNPGNGISGYCPGLLWILQSAVPEKPATYHYEAVPTAGNPSYDTFYGYGTNSRLGTKDIYVECRKYTEVANKAAFSAWKQFWRDADNLYIASGFYGGCSHDQPLCADMAFDAMIRLRDLDNGTQKITAPLKTNYNKGWDVFVKLVEACGMNVFVWYDADGYTYLDVLDSEGRGSSTGLYTLYEDEVTSEPLPPATWRCSALIGLGNGDGPTQQRYTAMDLSYKGLWVEEVENIAGGFADDDGDLSTVIEDRFDARNADLGYRVEWPESAPSPRPTDHINFVDAEGVAQVFQIKTARLGSEGPAVVDVGCSPDELIDAFHPTSEIPDIYSLESPFNATGPGSLSGNITIGDTDTACTGRTITGTIDARVKNGNYRVLLSYSYDSGYVPMLAVTWVDVNGSQLLPYGHCWHGYMLNDSITDMDITDLCKCDGTIETIKIYVEIYGLWSGAGPTVSLSTTVQPVWRRDAPAG